ncbi:MAG: SDR family NAD(P)-dependent oxidoreductase [Patescibacteria group bacterium]|nr:SDR family NAD(P)-dependent oxidoreductase [Patescibacteria group bacterium]
MQTVLITGVGRGIGKALAQTFLEKGFFVIGTTTTGTADFARENLFVCKLNLSSTKSTKECVEAIHGLGKKINILINNAGVLLDEDETTLIPERLRATLEVNLIGTADFTEHLIAGMAPHGHIIFISSTAGSLEQTGHLESHWPNHYPAYKISKAALNMYMRTLAQRLKKDGLIVSSVHPGWVKTAMGGDEADITPEEAVGAIYKFTLTSPETGFFWFKNEKLPW